MALVFLIGDLPEVLREQTAVMTDIATAIHQNNDLLCRIAEALEKRPTPKAISPEYEEYLVKKYGWDRFRSDPPPCGPPVPKMTDEPQRFHVAESPEEHQERTSKEAALAISLGVAPWSPDFEKAITYMRNEVLRSPKIELDGEGNEISRRPYTEAEADDIVREGFLLAKGIANQV